MSLNKGTVWFDVDGVLLDYLGYFLMEYRGKFKPEYRYITPREIVTYDMSYLFPEGQEEFIDTIWESHNRVEAGMMRRICSPHKLHSLKNMGYQLNLITQFEGMDRYKRARIDNLSREFGPVFDEIIFTKRGECKLDLLNHREIDYLVEDNPHLIEAYDQGGWKTDFDLLVIQHPYNQEQREAFPEIPSFTYADYAIDHIIERNL